ncbi:MAG: hypothetical protein OEO20_04035 [Gemmatimonadota bacterium]|nr:hypothetical protein [Gemmatimonadota bacterium]MDH3367489.1 hypothetical protein [Gemmatimonadota bacterium]MDH3477455.1 hypothetical protein [Gemmatimonadota bacterium]MDH3569412.1 hypothetical protein [Gemmatimonadota bacterium]MDH5549254.1 hypothetical protein [Gemmatimonadota bacterium]
MRRLRSFLLALCLGLAAVTLHTTTAAAQQTPADTAAILVQTARELDASGRYELAEELLRYVVDRYPGTPAAARAADLLAGLRRSMTLGGGRTGFVVWNTLFLSWLGIATPAALGAESATPYGAGLLVGAPLGFFASRAYAGATPLTAGQAGLYSLSTVWLSWQAAGWREVLGVGDDEFCFQTPTGEVCDSSSPSEAVFAALLVGGVAGIGTGLALSRVDVDNGTATLIRHASLWGTWYGFAAGVLAGAENNALLTTTLLGGNAFMAAALPIASAWRPTPSQVRITSAAGLAGGIAGLGLDLLFDVNDNQAAVAIPTAGATLGLGLGATLLSPRRSIERREASAIPRLALVTLDRGMMLDLPVPLPTAVPQLSRDGRIHLTPAVQVRLFEAHF